MTNKQVRRMLVDALYDLTGGTKFSHIPSVYTAQKWMKENDVTPTACAGPGATHQREPKSRFCNPHYQQLQYHKFDESKLTPRLMREAPTTTISAQVPLRVFDELIIADPQGKWMRAARIVYTELATGVLVRQRRSASKPSADETNKKQVSIKVGDTLAKAVQAYKPSLTIHAAGAAVLSDWASGALVRRQP